MCSDPSLCLFVGIIVFGIFIGDMEFLFFFFVTIIVFDFVWKQRLIEKQVLENFHARRSLVCWKFETKFLPFNWPGFLSGSRSNEIRLSPSPTSNQRSTGNLDFQSIQCNSNMNSLYLYVWFCVTCRISIESTYQPEPMPVPSCSIRIVFIWKEFIGMFSLSIRFYLLFQHQRCRYENDLYYQIRRSYVMDHLLDPNDIVRFYFSHRKYSDRYSHL